MKSWKSEVLVGREWVTNSCRYATREEAEAAGRELLSRWFAPTDSRAVPAEEPVNYRFNLETGQNEPVTATILPVPAPCVALAA
jgi:hypothetical protein